MANVNNMGFNQLSTVLNSIVEQATGKASITPTNESEFVSVAQTALKTGYDPVMNAISQVLSRTIFSIRPYSAKFKGLMADSVRYGNHVRKINICDKDFEDDARLNLTDGQSVDAYKINKPKALQTNIYGQNVWAKSVTMFKDQLDAAFSSSAEFGNFIQMVVQNASDMLEQARESLARATVCNYIAGKTQCDSGNVIYLLDKYKEETDTDVTAQSVKTPTNFVPFAKWLFGYLKTVSDLMTERSVTYHQNFVDSSSNPLYISRHTPLDKQKIYLYSRELNNIDSSVLSGVYHDEYLKIADHERVNFWQSIKNPMQIKVTPSYTAADGTVVTAPAAVTLDNVFGVIFDEEACGYTVVNNSVANTPLNAKGMFYNTFYHEDQRYWNDFTENGVVLILDHAPSALTVSSVAGSTSGTTTITLTESKITATDTYVYHVGDNGLVPAYNEVLDDSDVWTAWDGSSDITAATGNIITIAEVDTSTKCVASGFTTVVSND